MTPRSAAAPALAALLAASPVGAPALTFDIVNNLQISEFESGPGDSVSDRDAEGTNRPTQDSSTATAATTTLSATGDEGTGSAGASSSVDTVTGELKARTQTSASGFATLANGFVAVEFYETFVVNGTGDLTALFAVDFASVVTGPDLGTLNTRVEADLSVNNGDSRPNTSGGTGINTPTLSSLVETGNSFSFDDRILSVTTEFENAEDRLFTVLWRLEVTAVATEQGTAIADASNTGTAFIETTGTLTAVPEVPTTLSEARFPGDVAAIVPLPPTLLLMLGGLAALGVGGLRRG